MSSKYANLTIKELKEELKKRGAKLSGKKNDLIQRLESYERNANFGEVLERESFNMDIPDLDFKDINTDTKLSLTEEKVKMYMELFEQDLQQKSIAMYNARFLKNIRAAIHESGDTYICARVSAEMTKKCVYKVDVKFDNFGVVKEAQCECAAGMGPEAHCKHVGLVLYALTQGPKGILTEVTCTQRLQTFHQVKQHSGSPVKMENLMLRDETSRLKHLKDFDPRPLALRKQPGYESQFRSVWLNSSASNCPVRQLFGPANVYAINNDHDYLTKSPENIFLDNIGVTYLTYDQCKTIELTTKGQSSNKMWKEERLLRMHASSCGKIVKMTDRTDAKKLAKSLTEHRNITSDSLKHGRKYEETAKKAYADDKNMDVTDCGIYINPTYPFIGCSPDGIVQDGGIIEIKCPYSARDSLITPTTVPYLYVDDNKNLCLKKDHDYYFQVMCTMLCTEKDWCDFIVWTFKDIKVVHILKDDSAIQLIISKLGDFFSSHFKQALLDKFFYRNTHQLLPQ